MEVPGLVVQILNPPTHYLPQTAPPSIEIRANVTMMCGCPIGKGHPPWNPEQFEVMAVIKQGEYSSIELPLKYDEDAPYAAPSQFVNTWPVPANDTGQLQIYEITVSAFQQKTGNTGVAKATIIIPPASTASTARIRKVKVISCGHFRLAANEHRDTRS